MRFFSEQRLRWLAPTLWVGVIFLFSLSSDPGGPLPGAFVSALSPVAHILEFAILGYLIYLLRPFGGSTKLYILFGVLIAFLDELLQLTVPGRVTDVWDFVADTGGFAIGLLFAPRLLRHGRKVQLFAVFALLISVVRFLIW